MRTLGQRLYKIEPAAGFSAQVSAGAVIDVATRLGYPLSTTHVISGGVLGAGSTRRLSAVRWGIAGNIVVAWFLTIPAAALVAAVLLLAGRGDLLGPTRPSRTVHRSAAHAPAPAGAHSAPWSRSAPSIGTILLLTGEERAALARVLQVVEDDWWLDELEQALLERLEVGPRRARAGLISQPARGAVSIAGRLARATISENRPGRADENRSSRVP